jgi:hypothetical protein
VKWTGKRRGDLAEYWNIPAPSTRQNTFTTDSRGFRNRRELESADIVLIGDSYVEGFYVSDHETAAAVLEDLSGASVANLGQSGYGSLQELEILRRFGLALKPKMVAWFFFEGNDLYDDEAFEGMSIYLKEHGTFKTATPKKRSWDSRWKAFLKTSFTRHTFRQIRRLAHPLVPNGVASFGWFRDEHGQTHSLYFYDYGSLVFTEYEQSRFETTQKTLLSAQRECEEQGVRFIVFFIPMKFRVYGEFCTFPAYSRCSKWKPWDLNRRMADFCREADISFVDMSEPMKAAAASGRLLYAPEDSHWNAEGHRFVAELVQKAWLEKEN